VPAHGKLSRRRTRPGHRPLARLAARTMIAAPTAVLGAAGGWWALSKRLPALDDEEWPYVGYAAAHPHERAAASSALTSERRAA
jgi:hypothetical protein